MNVRLQSRLAATLCTVGLLGLTAIGCGPKKVDQKPPPDQDFNSGPDGKRTGAIKIEVNRITAPDEVNFDKGDQTDWKSIDLTGHAALLNVELHWDNANSDMNVDIFDPTGTNIASSPGPQPGAQSKKLVAQIDTLGMYYIRVQAPKAGDGSVYTLDPRWEGYEASAANPETLAPPPEKKHREHHASSGEGEEHKHKEKKSSGGKFEPENGVQGRIVSSYREGGSMVLHIDKGSAAGVQVGQNGAILDGPGGANALEGGSFTITQVVDESKSIGKTNLHSLGKNNRVSINVK